MIGIMASQWNQKIHLELPGKWTPHNEPVRRILKEYFKMIGVTAACFENSLPSYLSDLERPVLDTEDKIAAKVDKVLSMFRKNSDAIRPAIEATTENMARPFAAAEDITGSSWKSFKVRFGCIRADRKIGEGSYAKRRDILEQYVNEHAPAYFDSAWAAMKTDLGRKKEETKNSLKRVAEEAAQACHVHINLLIHKLLGNPDSPQKLTIQSRVQTVLGEWRSEWQCPSGYDNHILQKDLSIPPELRAEDLAAIKRQDDDDSESGSDSEDDDEVKKNHG